MKKKQDKFRSRKADSYKRELKEIELRQGKKEPLIVLSFRNFDRNQGQSFKEWELSNLLALAVEKLSAVCNKTVGQATAEQIIKPYTKVGFPPESNFIYPLHVPPDVIWCSMHIQGKECVIGYFEENIFNVVFLDAKHEFWKSEKKHT